MSDISKLLKKLVLIKKSLRPKRLPFRSGRRGVYNITSLLWHGKTYLPGRVEPRIKKLPRYFLEEIERDTYKATISNS